MCDVIENRQATGTEEQIPEEYRRIREVSAQIETPHRL